MITPIKLIGSVVYRTREALNNNQQFMQGLKDYYRYDLFSSGMNFWHYPGTAEEISNTLLSIQQSPDSTKIKFPALFNFHPIEQTYGGILPSYKYNMAFVAPTKSEWTTEQREKFVFEPLLRPMYAEFMTQLSKSGRYFQLPYIIPHSMYEVYTTGNKQDELIRGRYSDYIDAIEVHNLTLMVKNLCKQDIDQIVYENSLIQ